MTRLLVSVRSLEEAHLVAQSDVAILDIKEPDQGALGAAQPETLAAISHEYQGQMLLSFAAGELKDLLNDETGSPLTLEAAIISERFDYSKVGLAGMAPRNNWYELWAESWKRLPKTNGRVAVAYADHSLCEAPHFEEVFEAAKSLPCEVLLLDTYVKSNRKNVLDWLPPNELNKFIRRCRSSRLKIVIAGSVNESTLESLLAMHPDFIGVRGAVCDQSRRGAISKTKLNCFVNRMERFKLQNGPISNGYPTD